MAVGMRPHEEQLQSGGTPCGKEGLPGPLSPVGGATGRPEGVGVSKDKFASRGVKGGEAGLLSVNDPQTEWPPGFSASIVGAWVTPESTDGPILENLPE